MEFINISGLHKKISRLGLGTIKLIDYSKAYGIYDLFFQSGGNCIDTAWIYNDGKSERVLGEWISSNNVRDSLFIITKGAHPPYCDSKYIESQLFESLERLKIESIDLYFLHRDNTSIPVDEWIDVLNNLVDKRLISAFGGSNWSQERIDEANCWAQKNNKKGFSAVSNQFSFIKMCNPPWPGCLSSSSPEYFAWHIKNKFPLFSWSSLAQGYCSNNNSSINISCWKSKENDQRMHRLKILANKKRAAITTLALSYLFSLNFPLVALIGTDNIDHLHELLNTTSIILDHDELSWLED